MAREIPLNKGLVAIVDDADYPALSAYKWHAHKNKAAHTAYAVRTVNDRRVYMHKIILGVPKNQRVDHRDGNGLNNQRANLRPCSNAQNAMNARKRGDAPTSQYKGVSWRKQEKRFLAKIKLSGKVYYLGLHKNEVNAALAYNAAALNFFGEFARINNVTQHQVAASQ